MFILFPVTLFFCLWNFNNKSSFLVALTGFLTGVAVCVISSLVSFRHRIPEYSFGSNFLYFACREYVLPIMILFVAYFFLSKDGYEFRIKSFLLISLSFYSIFMPYSIVSEVDSYSSLSFFQLFLKPLLFDSMVVSSVYLLLRLSRVAIEKNKVKFVVYSIILAVELCIPPLLNTFWLLNWLKPLFYVLSCVYILSSGVFFLVGSISENGFSMNND